MVFLLIVQPKSPAVVSLLRLHDCTHWCCTCKQWGQYNIILMKNIKMFQLFHWHEIGTLPIQVRFSLFIIFKYTSSVYAVVCTGSKRQSTLLKWCSSAKTLVLGWSCVSGDLTMKQITCCCITSCLLFGGLEALKLNFLQWPQVNIFSFGLLVDMHCY